MSKKDCKLLPHIRENLYGFNSSSMQMIPWAIKVFDVEKIWKKSTGKNIKVAVIDTGCDKDHLDIKNNLLKGYNCIENNDNTDDDNGHGTHVAGTIGAINNSLGIVGTAPDVKIIPVKALNKNGEGSNSWVAKGVKWAVDNGANLITMSLGSTHKSRQLEEAISYATLKNVLVFCAAGNSGNHTDVQYPAKYAQTISVGAVNRHLKICNFSCVGDTLDFLGPGEDIISCVPNSSYASMSGTSMATPFAVGCAALAMSQDSSLNTKEKIINTFKNNTIKLNDHHSGDSKYEGYGIIRPI